MNNSTAPITATLSGENTSGELENVTFLLEDGFFKKFNGSNLPFANISPTTSFSLGVHNFKSRETREFSARAIELSENNIDEPVDVELYIQSEISTNIYVENFQRSVLDLTNATTDTKISFHNVPTVVASAGSGDDNISINSIQDMHTPTLSILEGFAGDDTFYIQATQGGIVWIDAGTGNDKIGVFSLHETPGPLQTTQTVSAFDSLGDLIAYGGEGNDEIIGGQGQDIMFGDAGDDVLHTLGNSNIVNGGDGDDYLDVIGSENILSGGKGADNLYTTGDANVMDSGDGDDGLLAEGNRNILLGGEGDDGLSVIGDKNVATGNQGLDLIIIRGDANIIDGGANADRIDVIGEDNIILGDHGTDFIHVSGDSNTVDGGDSDDILDIDGHDNITLGDQGLDEISAVGNDNIINGGDDNDTLYTGGNNNIVFGDQGLDEIFAVGNDNIINGGDDNDTLYTGGNNNIVFGDQGMDDIDVRGSKNIINGGDGKDFLYIEGDTNTVDGGAENDTLRITGSGNLVMGGEGSDQFLHVPIGGEANRILDFETGSGGDVLLMGDILTYDNEADIIEDFIRLQTQDTKTIIEINADGQGTDFETLVHLDGVTDVSLDDLITHGNIEV